MLYPENVPFSDLKNAVDFLDIISTPIGCDGIKIGVQKSFFVLAHLFDIVDHIYEKLIMSDDYLRECSTWGTGYWKFFEKNSSEEHLVQNKNGHRFAKTIYFKKIYDEGNCFRVGFRLNKGECFFYMDCWVNDRQIKQLEEKKQKRKNVIEVDNLAEEAVNFWKEIQNKVKRNLKK